MALSDARKCDAKAKRTGERCMLPAMIGSTKCRVHGGKTPKGADSPHFKHGRYSKVVRGKIAERIADVDDHNPLDLLDELKIQRALFAEYVSRFEVSQALTASDINLLMGWSSEITRTVERMVKMRNETALTGAEVRYLAVRAAELVAEYIPDVDRQTAFIRALFGEFGQSDRRTPELVAESDNNR